MNRRILLRLLDTVVEPIENLVHKETASIQLNLFKVRGLVQAGAEFQTIMNDNADGRKITIYTYHMNDKCVKETNIITLQMWRS